MPFETLKIYMKKLVLNGYEFMYTHKFYILGCCNGK